MYVEVEIDTDDIIADLSEKDYRDLVADGLESGYIPAGWVNIMRDDGVDGLVQNPETLLLVITTLRKMGYTVEPGE